MTCARTSASASTRRSCRRRRSDGASRRRRASSGSKTLLDRRPSAAVRRPAPARRDRPRDGARPRRPSCSTSRCPTSTRSCAPRCGIEIKRLHQRLGTTIVFVTHDQVEAMTMADRIVVMRDGRILQVGTPIGALRAAGRRLHRPLHRQPVDEHPARPAIRRRAADRRSRPRRRAPRPAGRRRGARRPGTSSSGSGRRTSPS